MERRKFIVGLGSLAAGASAAMGTGAFEGAYIAQERDLDMTVVNDPNGYLKLKDTSPYAELVSESRGSFEGSATELKLTLDRLNPDADTRLDDVFRVQNTTGASGELVIRDLDQSVSGVPGDGTNEDEDVFQVYGETGSDPFTRLDNGGSITLSPGEEAKISVIVLLKDNNPNLSDMPDKLLVVLDGTS